MPRLTEATLECDVDAGRWTLRATTSAWVGGATSDWTVNGTYVEHHDLDGIRFEADGSGEELRARLDIVRDFRKQNRGRTAFTCASEVDVLVTSTDYDGTVTDCLAIGPQPERWACPATEATEATASR